MRPLQFRRASAGRDAPEISLIAFIDVLLVILIFMMLSSSYSRLTQVKVQLPVADSQASSQESQRIHLAVSADGRYAIGNEALAPSTARSLEERLRTAKLLAAPDAASMASAGSAGQDTVLVISADAAASHQAVIVAMTAANRAGLQQLTFMSQRSAGAKKQGQSP